ncbi:MULTISPECIES: hypothetical protein [Cysteiniphilum]|uniref:Lipoprotein n=1 Tax=Cysteiniphilum litorale TaxID=2056700 RepID=A0A8J2Z4Z8_9GAMM|nr:MULTISPECIES: hypothetical protein [Cysteiniphilum]GGF99828.1 hypothetical protein GCM10010995_16400 [Cysteiniphilum litorale]
MKFKQLSAMASLLTSGGCFASSLHPVTFQNDTNDTGLSVNYITGHKYSKCISYVSPQALMIAPDGAEISNFKDRDNNSCSKANKRASWILKVAGGGEAIITFKREPSSKDIFNVYTWNEFLVVNGEKVKANDVIPLGNYQLKINSMNYVTVIPKK